MKMEARQRAVMDALAGRARAHVVLTTNFRHVAGFAWDNQDDAFRMAINPRTVVAMVTNGSLRFAFDMGDPVDILVYKLTAGGS